MGFLVTGVLAGPQGLGLIHAVDQVSVLAEIGVILLLFSIGLEVSLKDLLNIKKYVLVGGSLQVALTTIGVFAILKFLGWPVGTSILLGFLISLSSTAIVLRIIQSKLEFYTPQGRTILGILIFQDIAIVPMMLATPLLPGVTGGVADSPLAILAKGLGLIILVIVSAKWVVPKALYHIAKIGDRELFLLSLVAICFAVAWITSLAGLSLGLGAFLAGLTISESQYSHQAFGNVLPLRDVFTSFFFVSIGMLLDINFLMQNPVYIALLAIRRHHIKSPDRKFCDSTYRASVSHNNSGGSSPEPDRRILLRSLSGRSGVRSALRRGLSDISCSDCAEHGCHISHHDHISQGS